MSSFYESEDYDASIDEYNLIKDITESDEDEVVDATYELNNEPESEPEDDELWDSEDEIEEQEPDYDSDVSDEDDEIDSDDYQEDEDDDD